MISPLQMSSYLKKRLCPFMIALAVCMSHLWGGEKSLSNKEGMTDDECIVVIKKALAGDFRPLRESIGKASEGQKFTIIRRLSYKAEKKEVRLFLISLSDDPAPYVRQRCILVLAPYIGHQRVLKRLVALLNDSHSTVKLTAFGAISRKYHLGLHQRSKEMPIVDKDVILLELRPSKVKKVIIGAETVKRIKGTDADSRTNALKEVTRQMTKGASLSQELFDALVNAYSEETATQSDKQVILYILCGQARDLRALPLVKKALKSKDPETRFMAETSLASLKFKQRSQDEEKLLQALEKWEGK